MLQLFFKKSLQVQVMESKIWLLTLFAFSLTTDEFDHFSKSFLTVMFPMSWAAFSCSVSIFPKNYFLSL